MGVSLCQSRLGEKLSKNLANLGVIHRFSSCVLEEPEIRQFINRHTQPEKFFLSIEYHLTQHLGELSRHIDLSGESMLWRSYLTSDDSPFDVDEAFYEIEVFYLQSPCLTYPKSSPSKQEEKRKVVPGVLPCGLQKQHKLLSGKDLLANPDLLLAFGPALHRRVALGLQVRHIYGDNPVLDCGFKHCVQTCSDNPHRVLSEGRFTVHFLLLGLFSQE